VQARGALEDLVRGLARLALQVRHRKRTSTSLVDDAEAPMRRDRAGDLQEGDRGHEGPVDTDARPVDEVSRAVPALDRDLPAACV
jgi:hypothetical protein